MGRAHVIACARTILAALALSLPLAATAQPIIVGGETIADETLAAAGRKEGTLLLYGVYPEAGMDPIRAGFSKASGISTDYVRLITQRLHPRVVTEFSAGKLEADFVDLSDLTLIKDLVDKGILARPHKVPAFDRVAPALKDAQGRWYTFLRPCTAIVVNTARTKEAEYPASWLDVLDAKWAGRIGMPSIDAGGSSFSSYMFLRDRVAPDYWSRLAALKPRVYPSLLPATTDVARGETSLLIGGPEPLYEQIKAGAPLKVIFPKEGVACFPDVGGITSSTKRPNAAAVWLNYLVSKAGGAVIAATGAYASHPDVGPPAPNGVQYPPAAQVWDIDIDLWTAKRDRYSQEWRTAFGVK